MIYVSEKQLQQVEYLIQQSKLGNHILFAPEEIRGALTRDISESDAYAVEHHVERLISQPNLPAQRAYIERLDTNTRLDVVRTYLNIVENNLFESSEVRH